MNLGKNESFRIFAASGLSPESQRISPGGPVDNVWTGLPGSKACFIRRLASAGAGLIKK